MRFVVASCIVACGAAMALARCSSSPPPCDPCLGDAQPLPLVVDVVPLEVWAQSGGTATVQISLGRGAGGDGDVAISLTSDAGAGVTADSLTIAAADTKGTLTVHVEPSFTQGSTTMTVEAASSSALATTPLVVHVAGASQTLDTTFGSGGRADLSPASGSEVGRALIMLQGGLFVGGTHTETSDAGTSSSMRVLKLTSGGSIDGAFAETTAPGELGSIVLSPSGAVYAGGTIRSPKADFSAVRILAAGGLDPKFAVATTLTSGDDVALGAIVEPGGNLVVAGSAGGESAVALARYMQSATAVPDASVDAATTAFLDPTFGDAGIVVTSVGATSRAQSLLVASDGTLYAVGEANGAGIAIHYGVTGGVDTAFADGGVVTLSSLGPAAAALLEPNGAIVAVSGDRAVRVLPSGLLDAAFNTAPLGLFTAATALTVDPGRGDLVIGGWSAGSCVIARVSSTGASTSSFTITEGNACQVAAVGVDGDGKILVLETVTSGSTTHMVVARYWP